MTEYVTYDIDHGFNIIDVDKDDLEYEEADVLDRADEFDPVILARIRELLK